MKIVSDLDYAAFLENQEKVYDGFRQTDLHKVEVIVSSELVDRIAGYVIALRHEEALISKIAAFSVAIHEILPTVKYDRDNLHTTISDYAKAPVPKFEPNEPIFDTLCEIVENIDPGIWHGIRISFREWLVNSNAIIGAGYPNINFVQTAYLIQYEGHRRGLNLRLPWGAHITASRFVAPLSSAALPEISGIIDNYHMDLVTTPIAIEVAEFRFEESAYILDTHRRFE